MTSFQLNCNLCNNAWQRCQFHLQHNAQGYVSKLDQRMPVARTIRSIFNAPGCQ
jgi:transposase-like protein